MPNEQEQLARALQESEDRFFRLFHASSNLMTITSIKDGRIIDVNEAAAALGGFTSEEMIGAVGMQSRLWADPKQRDLIVSKLRAGLAVRNTEVAFLTKAGDVRTVLFSADPISIAGEPCLLAVAIDITSREKEADALRKSEEKYRRLVENSLQGVVIIQDGLLVFCNSTYARITGYTVEELLAKSSDELGQMMHPDDREIAWNRYQDRLAGKPVTPRYEYRGIRKDGNEFWVEVYGSLTEHNGKPATQLAYFDITERKRAEAEAIESGERLNLALQAAGMATWDLNHQTGEARDEQGWLESLGYQPGEIEPNLKNFAALVHPDDLQEIERAVSDHVKGKAEYYSVEYRFLNKFGSWVWILDRGKLVSRDSSGRPLRTMGVHLNITAHKHAMAQIRQLAGEQRTILNTIGTGICYLKNRKIQWANSIFANMFGYEIGELWGMDASIFYSTQEDYERIGSDGYTQLKEGLTYSTEALMYKRDGSLFWCILTGKAIDPRDLGKGSIWVLNDITERRRTEKALLDSELKFRSLVETTNDLVWETNRDGAYTYVSPQVKDLLGYEPQEMLGKTPLDFMHPNEAKRVAALFMEIAESHEPFAGLQNICLRNDGREIVLETNGVPYEDSQKNLLGYRGIARDITERRQAEEALQESKEYLNQIINNIGDPVFVKDREHRLVLVNDAWCTLAGVPREEIIGDGSFRSIPEDVANILWDEEESVFEIGRELVTETSLLDRQGNSHVLMTKKSAIINKSGEKQIIGVLRDVTEYKRLEAQFFQAQKMEAVGVLAGGVAHDFNNLLNVINGYCELLLEDLAVDNTMRNDLEQVWKAGQRAASLTSQLLAFSRKQVLQPKIIDLNASIADMSKMLRRIIRENIKLTTLPQSGLGWVNADPGQIQQIVMNLAVNAQDAMPQGGTLTIETANVDFDEQCIRKHPDVQAGCYVMLAVRDNGTGMNAATQARIFEPFFTTKGRSKGTGLGLATVYGIVKQSNGFIWVESEPGKGTSFKVYFPRAEDDVFGIAEESKTNQEARGAETVLLSEDEQSVRALAARILRERGYTVLEASCGNKALDVAEKYAGEIHLAITDVVMPDISGTELVSRLKDLRPGIKVLYVSGYTDNAIVHHGILDSGVAFLQKPFSIESLTCKVREVLDS